MLCIDVVLSMKVCEARLTQRSASVTLLSLLQQPYKVVGFIISQRLKEQTLSCVGLQQRQNSNLAPPGVICSCVAFATTLAQLSRAWWWEAPSGRCGACLPSLHVEVSSPVQQLCEMIARAYIAFMVTCFCLK